ncbi:MAG: ferredoxin family protein [Verrucomicrobia bacterium]|nr:ferredoxin family protein [Verrucomicrobiota bacterium]
MNVRFLKWVPVVDQDRCNGCARCVEACGPKSLEIVNLKATLAWPESCGSEEHCVKPCPEGAILMGWVELDGDKTKGKWQADVVFDDAPKKSAPSGKTVCPSSHARHRKMHSEHHVSPE